MIKLSSVKMKPEHTREELLSSCARAAGLKAEDVTDLKILRRSIEARKKEPLSLVYSVLLTVRNEKKARSFFKSASGKNFLKKHSAAFVDKTEIYHFPVPAAENYTGKPPVIIGSGPAGLLCAYELALHGFAPVIVERGLPVEERLKKVREFWEKGTLDPECNVQFGEGGAGTFSDGKLNTGITDRFHRFEEVLNLFVSCGASEEILYDAKPHIGSDVLYTMIPKVRKRIEELGGTFLFGKRAEDLILENGRISAVLLSDGTELKTEAAVLAAGHSARDTFRMLYEHGASMEAKPFAVGVRCEHDQEMINRNQWGEEYPSSLGAAPYKLTYKTKEGRSVYTFCMCPGGYVVNASSEEGGTAVNGMSYEKRDSGRANSAVIVSVDPVDYRSYTSELVPEELSGAAFQRDLESKAFHAGNGLIPVSFYGDFAGCKTPDPAAEQTGCHKGAAKACDLHNILPDYIGSSIIEGMKAFDQKIPGFASADTLLYAVESRTSSPVRILRDDTFQSNIRGLYPCGEGAGYAGGILSAAVDGIKTAEALAKSLTESKS